MVVWIESPFDNLPAEGFRKQRYWLMAEAFVAAGHEVVYWTMDFNHGTKAKRQMPGGAAGKGIAVEMIAARPYRKNVSWRRVWSHLGYARDFERRATAAVELGELAKPALVIAATPTLGAASAAMRIARRYGAKFTLDIQDAWPETFYRLLPRGLKWLGALLFLPMRRTAARLYREADYVTGVSRRYAELSGRGDFHLAYHGISS